MANDARGQEAVAEVGGEQGVPQLDAGLGRDDVAITFVGHATFLIQTPTANILTDPMWSGRASPVQWLGHVRVRVPGIAFDDLPRIDLILMSHNHYDHLDKDTLLKIRRKFSPKVIVPTGDKALVESIGFTDVRELDWWDDVQIDPLLKITFAPTQHSSARGLFDRDKSLWGSYMIQSGDSRIYFGGDAGYSKHYKDIGIRLGAPDVSLLGIGAYEPQWFMKPMHMNPMEAVKAHQDMDSKLSIAMHFGTFHMSAEAFDQPKADLKTALSAAGVGESHFIALEEGETFVHSPGKSGPD
ncbi:MAG: MBL fold metallo-hydrolase [Azoarcus sp.]|jgi:L-ascorbate metabolism protein UlaG (beta-lactamase superfamily)|nr:MBL fold metallo-hydrolase [Azoarcus sp.]